MNNLSQPFPTLILLHYKMHINKKIVIEHSYIEQKNFSLFCDVDYSTTSVWERKILFHVGKNNGEEMAIVLMAGKTSILHHVCSGKAFWYIRHQGN